MIKTQRRAYAGVRDPDTAKLNLPDGFNPWICFVTLVLAVTATPTPLPLLLSPRQQFPLCLKTSSEATSK